MRISLCRRKSRVFWVLYIRTHIGTGRTDVGTRVGGVSLQVEGNQW